MAQTCTEQHRCCRELGPAHSDSTLAVMQTRRRGIVRSMDAIDELLANNANFTARHGQRHMDVRPSLHLAVVACMDSRLDIFAALGLNSGEAHVLRNAGGVVTDDVVRSLAISQRRLGTTRIMLIHHTDCGLQGITDDGFRAELQRDTGVAPAFAIESFTDVDADVRQSMIRIQRSPFIAHRGLVRGFVYETNTGHLREVERERGFQIEDRDR